MGRGRRAGMLKGHGRSLLHPTRESHRFPGQPRTFTAFGATLRNAVIPFEQTLSDMLEYWRAR